MQQKKFFRSNEAKYFESLKVMVQFEEVAQTIFVQNFNTDGIKVFEYFDSDCKTTKNMFYFPINVSDGRNI